MEIRRRNKALWAPVEEANRLAFDHDPFIEVQDLGGDGVLSPDNIEESQRIRRRGIPVRLPVEQNLYTMTPMRLQFRLHIDDDLEPFSFLPDMGSGAWFPDPDLVIDGLWCNSWRGTFKGRHH